MVSPATGVSFTSRSKSSWCSLPLSGFTSPITGNCPFSAPPCSLNPRSPLGPLDNTISCTLLVQWLFFFRLLDMFGVVNVTGEQPWKCVIRPVSSLKLHDQCLWMGRVSISAADPQQPLKTAPLTVTVMSDSRMSRSFEPVLFDDSSEPNREAFVNHSATLGVKL